jgi:hypothetical protein
MSRKLISFDEVRNKGYLQEVNRQFFHPLGIALALIYDVDEETGERTATNQVEFLDCRNDPEGYCFDEEYMRENAERFWARSENVLEEFAAKAHARSHLFGYYVQSLPKKLSDDG